MALFQHLIRQQALEIKEEYHLTIRWCGTRKKPRPPQLFVSCHNFSMNIYQKEVHAMEPSSAICKLLDSIANKVKGSDELSLVQMINDNQLTINVVNFDYLPLELTDEEMRATQISKDLLALKSEKEKLCSDISNIKKNIETAKPPLLFGKSKFQEQIKNLKYELEALLSKSDELEKNMGEKTLYLENNQQIINGVREKEANIESQYEIDKAYFLEKIQNLENLAVSTLIGKTPIEQLTSHDIEEKIDLIKNNAYKYSMIFPKLQWKNSLPFMYFICITLDEIDDSKIIFIEKKEQSLKSFCENLLWNFVEGAGDQYNKEIDYWVVRLRAYFQRFNYDHELDYMSNQVIRLWQEDQMAFAKYIVDTVLNSSKLKETLSEIRSCLSTGKRLSVEREDETMTEYFNSQQQAFNDNELMNLFKTYGL